MMTLEELQKKLESYPERLEKALVHQSESEAAVEQIQEEMKLAQSGLMEQENPEGEPAVEGETYEQVRLRYDTRAAELELQIRKNPAAFGIVTPKPTESTIRAALRSNDELVKLKALLIELEGQRRPTMFHREQLKMSIDEKLQQKLWKAEETAWNADAQVEAIRSELDTYRMLTIILVNRSVSASLSLE